MSKKNLYLTIIIIVLLIVTVFTVITLKNKRSSVLAIPNPASQNCIQVGGSWTQETGPGGSYGLCHFDDNRACEEWALYKGDCPVGGRKTTGYDTIDQNFCAWAGGTTYATPNSICTFKNGTKCSTKAFYENGSCNVKQ